MRKASKLTVFIFSGLLQASVLLSGAHAETPGEILAEAANLVALEKEYFDARQNSQWDKLYETQHPEYKNKISLEEYTFFEGKVAYNYRDIAGSHISGLLTPPLSYIKKSPEKKDALGFPVPRKFKWFYNPFINIQDYVQDTISVSKDGRHAIVRITLTGREKLNPALVRELYEFDFKRHHIDFWEKVNGRWVIAVLTEAASVSGVKVLYYVPNNNDAWGKMDFYDIDPKGLAGPAEGK